MELFYEKMMFLIETAGVWAPFCFILLHLLRPLFFLPVVFLCMTGGLLFGSFWGTVYSLIGVTLSSLLFYQLRTHMPKPFHKIDMLKNKIFSKRRELTVPQIALLRLLPFMHFYLLSLCLYDLATDFKDYAKSSVYTNLPLAILYTASGEWVSKLSPTITAILFLLLIPSLYMLRKKQATIEWQEFFPTRSH